ncbi:MAG TPA: hypothetical protein VE987_05385 [Polyangiaceae bacterium]|nr:hypothetical protein [Polyangiaceae bacterium]
MPRSSGAGEQIAVADRIEHIFRALARSHVTGILTDRGVTATLVGVVAIHDTGERLLRWTYDGPPWTGETIFEIAGPLSLYRCALEYTSELDGRLDTRLPAVLERVRTRREQRVPVPPRVFVRMRTRSGLLISRELHDVSHRGLAFAVAARDDISVGAEIDGVVIDWQSRLRICARLLVRHISEESMEGRRTAGAVVIFDSPEDALHWDVEVEALLEPATQTGGTWTRDLWELFERSGYFSLSNKAPDNFARLRHAFVSVSRKLAHAPGAGIQVVWPSGRGVEGSAAVVAINDQSVFMYQLGRRHGNPPVGVTGRAVVHGVFYRAIRWILTQRQFRWVVVWVQEAGRFSKRLQLDFVTRYADGQRASVVRFRALEIPTSTAPHSEIRRVGTSPPPRPKAAEQWTLSKARRAELERVGNAASAVFPPSFVAAHAIGVPGEEHSEEAGDALRRGREVVVATFDGAIQAAAILEWTEDGVHLYGLLDVMRVVPMGPSAEAAVPVLVEHARQRYASIGKAAFVFAADADLAVDRWPEGATDLGVTYCTVLSVELLPELADHSWELAHGAHD